MAGRFHQSCLWEPVTAGPPPAAVLVPLLERIRMILSLLGAGASRLLPKQAQHQTGHWLGWPLVVGQAQEARAGRWDGRQPWSRRFCLLRLHTSSFYSHFSLLRFALLHSIYYSP